MQDNIIATFTKFLKAINANVTKTSVEEYLATHPDYPSMAIYIDALEKWNIENAAVNMPDAQYSNCPTPHITYLRRNGGTFALVKKISDNSIEWYDTNSGWIKDSLNDFKKDWTSVVLFAETNKDSGESDFRNKQKSEFLRNIRIPLAISTALFATLLFTFLNHFVTTWVSTLLLFLKMGGILISSLLLVKHIDKNNVIANLACNLGKKVNCQSVLDSKAANLTSWLSLTDIGFIYFFGTFVSLILSSNSQFYLSHFLPVQFLLAPFGVLFSFYSIYSQYFILKIWCLLCLGVMAIFWAEFISMAAYFSTETYELLVNKEFLVISIISLLVPVSFLLFYKTTAIKAGQTNSFKNELNRLKNNPNIFKSLLLSQKPIPFIPEGIGIVIIGNLDAQHILTIISNPLCSPCSRMHRKIETLLSKTDNVKCRIIFKTNEDEDDEGGKFVRKIFSLSTSQQHQAIKSWFERNDMNFDEWNKPYQHLSEKSVAKIWKEDQNFWANEAGIRRTPTLFFNNHQLPEIIQIEDLEQFMQFEQEYITTS